MQCSKCKKDCNPIHICDRETEDAQYCGGCFAVHPCGRGEHGEGCPTHVFSTEE